MPTAKELNLKEDDVVILDRGSCKSYIGWRMKLQRGKLTKRQKERARTLGTAVRVLAVNVLGPGHGNLGTMVEYMEDDTFDQYGKKGDVKHIHERYNGFIPEEILN